MPESPPFGVELRRRRVAAGLSLDALAKRVHYSKGFLSKVESGQASAGIALARLCDAELNAHGGLVQLLLATATTSDPNDQLDDAGPSRHQTWLIGVGGNGGYFSTEGDRLAADSAVPNSAGAAVGMVFDGHLGVDTNAALRPFLNRFDEARNLGQVTGSAALLPLVLVEARTLQLLAEHATSHDRAALFQLAARFAEFAGWMAQEAGDDRIAWWLTMKAVELADTAGDLTLRPYALIRRADIALYRDDALSVIQLAKMAQRHGHTPTRIRGLAAQREAQGHALAGDHTACLRAIERSAVLLDETATGTSTGPALGTVRTPDLVALTQGWCLHDLGRPGEAGAILDAGIAQFEPGAHRARMRYQARAALAYATAGALDRACGLVAPLLDQARVLDSATIRHDFSSLSKVLRRSRSHPAVCTLLPELTELLREKQGSLAVDVLFSQ